MGKARFEPLPNINVILSPTDQQGHQGPRRNNMKMRSGPFVDIGERGNQFHAGSGNQIVSDKGLSSVNV
eukprot:scaffold193320_cov69-Cyclotella_meneghiniana.AAC.1